MNGRQMHAHLCGAYGLANAHGSQQTVAELVGVSPPYYRAIVSGSRPLSAGVAASWLARAGLSVYRMADEVRVMPAGGIPLMPPDEGDPLIVAWELLDSLGRKAPRAALRAREALQKRLGGRARIAAYVARREAALEQAQTRIGGDS